MWLVIFETNTQINNYLVDIQTNLLHFGSNEYWIWIQSLTWSYKVFIEIISIIFSLINS